MFTEAVFALTVQPFLAVGYGHLDWSIAGGPDADSSPSVLSELNFSDLASVSGGAKVQAEWYWASPGMTLIVEAQGDVGSFVAGDGKDSDYNGDNRTGIYSLSTSEIHGDKLSNGETGIGIRIDLTEHQAVALYTGGYHAEQQLNFKNGRQLFAVTPIFSGTTLEDLDQNLRTNLDSDYQTRWQGSWIGLGYLYNHNQWALSFRLQHYDGNYYGEGRWNLRATGTDAFEQPRSFSHYADAQGWRYALSGTWQLNDSNGIFVSLENDQWETKTGYVISYFANVLPQLNHFNGAEWQQTRLQIGYYWRF